jgi:hypothetical protein
MLTQYLVLYPSYNLSAVSNGTTPYFILFTPAQDGGNTWYFVLGSLYIVLGTFIHSINPTLTVS